jgi:hypothetical protein
MPMSGKKIEKNKKMFFEILENFNFLVANLKPIFLLTW